MKTINGILGDRKASGVYLLEGTPDPVALQGLATGKGFVFFHIQGASAKDKKRFLTLAAEVFGFPEHFGHNWDAFEDCITDMSWKEAPGYVILYDQFEHLADSAPGEFETALEILKDAAEAWKNDDKAMYVILNGKPKAKWKLASVQP